MHFSGDWPSTEMSVFYTVYYLFIIIYCFSFSNMGSSCFPVLYSCKFVTFGYLQKFWSEKTSSSWKIVAVFTVFDISQNSESTYKYSACIEKIKTTYDIKYCYKI